MTTKQFTYFKSRAEENKAGESKGGKEIERVKRKGEKREGKRERKKSVGESREVEKERRGRE